MIRVVEENNKDRFEANCAKAIDEGFKLSSSSLGYVPVPYDSNYYMAIFYKDNNPLEDNTEAQKGE